MCYHITSNNINRKAVERKLNNEYDEQLKQLNVNCIGSNLFKIFLYISCIRPYIITISCIYLFLTPNSRSVFCAGVSLNIHSFIHSSIYTKSHIRI